MGKRRHVRVSPQGIPNERPPEPPTGRFPLFRDLFDQPGLWRGLQADPQELGLTYTQYIAIVALWEDDNQTVSSLGEKLFLESNTLTPILKKLESMGYLHRRRDAADERQVIAEPDRRRPAVAREGFGDEPGGGNGPRRRRVLENAEGRR